ncbi:hypothetical protein [Aegicerativicinus sediminis]|uniref:hypothetical protein n=1 Tax=Aegicerativicinus sediminis TaxID=2893202 RepID=UPI001E581841|nr:hypothetical protein [Aegicerativicinus sediminis]
MIKKLILVVFSLFFYSSFAQQSTASPYSFYGIGSLKFKGTVENRSMGGISVFTDSIHLNLQNPASFVGPNLEMWNNESRPVKFSVGGSYSSSRLKSQSSTADANATTFDYLALNFPAGRLGFALGLMPHSAVGYKLETIDGDRLTNRYVGEGGLNKAFLGVGYNISKGLNIGLQASYNFGNVQNNALKLLYTDEGGLVQFQTRENNRSDLSGINFNIGMNYKTMLTNKLELTLAATYSPESNLASENKRSFSTILFNPATGGEAVVSTVDADLESVNLRNTDLTLPSRLSVGGGLGGPRKWFVGVDYSSQSTSKFGNPIFDIQETNFVNASTIAIGGFYIPDYNSFSNYWKRIVYRAGVSAGHTGLKINGEDIREFGMSFGVGLPMSRSSLFHNANLGIELGQRGTTNENLIQENFFNFHLSLSLNDRWFEKRKYY